MPTQSLMMNPMLANLSPDDQQSLLQLQQRQAIGQALLQQGLSPIDTSNRQVGGMGYRISPLEGLAKMAQMYAGNKISADSMGRQAQLMGQMYGNAFGTNQQAPQQAPVDAGGMTGDQSGQGVISAPVATPGAAPSGAQLGAAMGGGLQAAPQVAMPNGALTLPGKTPQQSMMLFSMLGPEGYARVLSQWGAPTEASRMAMAAGMDPRAANANALYKANYIAPITGTGIFRDPRTMQPVASNPEIPAGTTPLFDASGNVAKVESIDGAQAAMQGNAAATAAGGAQFKRSDYYDPVRHQMVIGNEAGVTNPGAPPANLSNGMPPTQDGTPNGSPMTPLQRSVMNTESFGNPNAVSPKGAVGSMQTMPDTLKNPGFGVRPPQDNSPAEMQRVGVDFLGAMQHRYGNDSDAVIAYNMGPAATDKWIAGGRRWDQLPAETRNYVGKTLAQAQNYSASSGAPSGPLAAGPTLGEQANAEAQAKGQIDTMQKSYQNLQTVRSGAPAALQDVDNMAKLAQGANPLTIGPAGAKFAGLFSANAAEYEKSRDNLVTNLGSQLGINSDAARDLVYGSIPSYGAPKQAVQNGLQTLRGQIQTRLLKSDYLSDAYAGGDAKSYNQRENQFDQHVTPAIANIVAMPSGPARAQALKQAASDPQVRARLEWAAQNGVLK